LSHKNVELACSDLCLRKEWYAGFFALEVNMPVYDGLSFNEAMSILPEHIGLWLNLIMFTALLSVLFIKKREAQVILGAFVLSIPLTFYVYANVGIASKLVGLGHVVLWLPAGIFAIVQIWRKQLYRPQGAYDIAFVAWLSFASAFYLTSNYWDVPDAIMYVVNSCDTEDVSSDCNHVDLLERIAIHKDSR
jgi:hypothetical protein